MTHATDSDTNAERDYVMTALKDSDVIGGVDMYEAGDRLGGGPVNHYVTDGAVTVADLSEDREDTQAR